MGYLETRRVMSTYDKVISHPTLSESARIQLAQQAMDVGKTSTSSTAQTKFQGSIFYLIAALLGLVAVLVIVFVLVLALNGKTIDAAFYALGSAAIGGLAGVFNAPSGSAGKSGSSGSGDSGNGSTGGADAASTTLPSVVTPTASGT